VEQLVRFLATALAYVASLVGITLAAFFLVILLAGPHAGLPPSLETVVLALGWLAILILPVLVARSVWCRFSKS
jgi:hypothetical protein